MRLSLVICVCAVQLLGCGSPVEDRVIATVLEEPVQIDTLCKAGPCVDKGLKLRLAFDPGKYVSAQEVVRFEQYRVDYALNGTNLDLSFYAAPVSVDLAAMTTVELTLAPAGQSQRNAVLEEFRQKAVEGVGTLQLAGYDSQDEQVLIETDFELRFAPITDAADAAPAGEEVAP